jgi:phenylacetate-CoA ligase
MITTDTIPTDTQGTGYVRRSARVADRYEASFGKNNQTEQRLRATESMSNALQLEMRYGSRALLRDNLLCERMISELRSHETMSEDDIDALQAVSLHRTLVSGISKLPYYRRIPGRFPVAQAAEVLRRHFPIVDKDTLLQNPASLYPRSGRPVWWNSIGKSSGTTGTPISVFRNPKSLLMENAFIRRHWEWGGFRRGMRCAALRGDMIVPVDRARPPFWFRNRYNNQLLISSRHLTEACVDAIIDELQRFAPKMLQAYPSTAFALAQFLEQRNAHLSIPVIFTASEPLYSHQRELIEERFGARIMDMFGMAERVAFATECEFGSMHINPDYSYVELVDADGQPTRDVGYVVGTTFHNLAMPLVRYKLSDRTRWISGKCRCSRPFPMIEPVTGKLEDSIFGSNGAFVSPSVLTFAFKGLRNIRKSQVAQVAPERWEIRLVPTREFGVDDRQKLIDNVRKLVDPGVNVKVVIRDEIPCTASGKFRWVVNEWFKAEQKNHDLRDGMTRVTATEGMPGTASMAE